MSDAPRVSVVLTCFNLGRYLDEAVDSVFAQTFQDFEILIVDDGSTEPATVQLLAAYQRPRTRVVHIENTGLPGARNAGIQRTTGEYVCCLDADDILEKTYFEKAVRVLDADPSLAFASHWLRTFGDEEGDWKPESAGFPDLLDRNTINGAALVRRSALLAVGLFDESMRSGCEDWDLWISMVERGLPGTIIPEVLFFYRRRADSMSRLMMQGAKHVEIYRYLVEKHRASFEAHAVDLRMRRERDRVMLLRESHDLDLDTRRLRDEIERVREKLRLGARKVEQANWARDSARELERLAAAIASLRDQLAGEEAKTASLRAQLSDRERAMSERDADLDRRRQEIAALDEALRSARERAETLVRERDAVVNSRTWRLTRPARLAHWWLTK